jgi:hypothetical protein
MWSKVLLYSYAILNFDIGLGWAAFGEIFKLTWGLFRAEFLC